MQFLKVNWPAPYFIAAVTTQQNQHQPHNYNVATHVNDDVHVVMHNRKQVQASLEYRNEPHWLNQTHSNLCINIDNSNDNNGDASYTQQIEKPLVIMTADCLPIILCHPTEREIAAIHAGWRGLANGVIENTLKHLKKPLQEYIAWMGPAICDDCYTVGDELKQIFLSRFPNAKHCFHYKQQWHFSLTQMAQHILHQHGINKVYDAEECTYENPAFYSYRRNPQTGRIATLIWIKDV
jgi:polyphenol oxidase